MSNFKKDILHENEDKSDVRLNRFLSDAGFCSRREADRLIEAGRVTVAINHVPREMIEKEVR